MVAVTFFVTEETGVIEGFAVGFLPFMACFFFRLDVVGISPSYLIFVCVPALKLGDPMIYHPRQHLGRVGGVLLIAFLGITGITREHLH